MIMLLPTRGVRNEHVESLHKTKKMLSWGLSVLPLTEKGSPQTEVHHICFAAQLHQISICHCIFWVSFLIAFLQQQGFILADKRTKVEKTFSSVQVLRPGFASQVTHERLASA